MTVGSWERLFSQPPCGFPGGGTLAGGGALETLWARCASISIEEVIDEGSRRGPIPGDERKRRAEVREGGTELLKKVQGEKPDPPSMKGRSRR